MKRGDIVIHSLKPEWGDGVVDHVIKITHEGRPAQRVVVRFANHGRVTINTAVAALLPKGDSNKMIKTQSPPTNTGAATGTGGGWLGSLESAKQGDELWALPQAMSDPFVGLAQRLEATVAGYRFHQPPSGGNGQGRPQRGPDQQALPNPRDLLDWAVVQTGLNDPLSQFTRHELEQAFPRYARDIDRHLIELIRTAKRQMATDVIQQTQEFAKKKYPAAAEVIRRGVRG